MESNKNQGEENVYETNNIVLFQPAEITQENNEGNETFYSIVNPDQESEPDQESDSSASLKDQRIINQNFHQISHTSNKSINPYPEDDNKNQEVNCGPQLTQNITSLHRDNQNEKHNDLFPCTPSYFGSNEKQDCFSPYKPKENETLKSTKILINNNQSYNGSNNLNDQPFSQFAPLAFASANDSFFQEPHLTELKTKHDFVSENYGNKYIDEDSTKIQYLQTTEKVTNLETNLLDLNYEPEKDHFTNKRLKFQEPKPAYLQTLTNEVNLNTNVHKTQNKEALISKFNDLFLDSYNNFPSNDILVQNSEIKENTPSPISNHNNYSHQINKETGSYKQKSFDEPNSENFEVEYSYKKKLKSPEKKIHPEEQKYEKEYPCFEVKNDEIEAFKNESFENFSYNFKNEVQANSSTISNENSYQEKLNQKLTSYQKSNEKIEKSKIKVDQSFDEISSSDNEDRRGSSEKHTNEFETELSKEDKLRLKFDSDEMNAKHKKNQSLQFSHDKLKRENESHIQNKEETTYTVPTLNTSKLTDNSDGSKYSSEFDTTMKETSVSMSKFKIEIESKTGNLISSKRIYKVKGTLFETDDISNANTLLTDTDFEHFHAILTERFYFLPLPIPFHVFKVHKYDSRIQLKQEDVQKKYLSIISKISCIEDFGPFVSLLTDKASFDKLKAQETKGSLLFELAKTGIQNVSSYFTGQVLFDEGYFSRIEKKVDCMYFFIKENIEKFDRINSSLQIVFDNMRKVKHESLKIEVTLNEGSVCESREIQTSSQIPFYQKEVSSNINSSGKLDSTIMLLVDLFYNVCCCKESLGVRNKILKEKEMIQEHLNSHPHKTMFEKEQKLKEFLAYKHKYNVIEKKLKRELETKINDIESELKDILDKDVRSDFQNIYNFNFLNDQ